MREKKSRAFAQHVTGAQRFSGVAGIQRRLTEAANDLKENRDGKEVKGSNAFTEEQYRSFATLLLFALGLLRGAVVFLLWTRIAPKGAPDVTYQQCVAVGWVFSLMLGAGITARGAKESVVSRGVALANCLLALAIAGLWSLAARP